MKVSKNSSLNTNLLNNFKDYQKANVKLTIYSAFELSKDNIEKISKILSKKHNFIPQPIEVVIDNSLIAGIKVVFDSIVIDGTLKGKLKKIKESSEERI